MGIPLFYEEISTPVLRVCQQSQSVSHFKLNSIIKSTGPSGIEVCQDHIPLLQISVNNPIPMPKLEFSRCVCLPTCKVAPSLYVVSISAHWPMCSLLSNAKSEAKPKQINQKFYEFWIVLSLNVWKSRNSENHHMNVFHKNKPKEKRRKSPPCHFSELFQCSLEKPVVYLHVCVCLYVFGEINGLDGSGLWPPNYVPGPWVYFSSHLAEAQDFWN